MHKTPNCLSIFMFPNFTIDHEVACIKLPITCQHSHFLVSPSIAKLHVIQNFQSPTNTHIIACQHLCHHLSLQVPTPFNDIHLELLILLASCHHVQAMFTSCHLHSNICRGKLRSYLLCCPCSNFYLGAYFHF